MRDRSKLISIEISDKAKRIYDTVQHKGEFVSDAIVEKHSKDTGTDTQTQLDDHERRLKDLEKRIGKEE